MLESAFEVNLLGTVFSLLIAHLIGDFVLQNDWMAKGKSTSFKKLAVHIIVYTMVLAFFAFPLSQGSMMGAITFVLFNGLMHMATDFVTSKAVAKAFADGDTHGGFLVIGIDQTFHYFILFLTIPLLGI